MTIVPGRKVCTAFGSEDGVPLPIGRLGAWLHRAAGAIGRLAVFILLVASLGAIDSSTAMARPDKAPSIFAWLTTSRQHTVLVKLVQAAGLEDRLTGKGSLTLFAPTDDAFGKLPPGALEMLASPSNREQLNSILRYHILDRSMSARTILSRIGSTGAGVALPNLQGEPLLATRDDDRIVLTDAKGGRAHVIGIAARTRNGTVFVLDAVVKSHHAPLTPVGR